MVYKVLPQLFTQVKTHNCLERWLLLPFPILQMGKMKLREELDWPNANGSRSSSLEFRILDT